MLTDGEEMGPGPDPLAGGGDGVEVVNGPAGGVGAVECISGGPVGAVGNGLVKLPVVQTGESAPLVDDTGHGVGEGGVVHAVQDHGPYGYLTLIRFSPGFGADEPGQQVDITVPLSPAAFFRDAESRQRGGAHLAVGGETVFLLKLFYGPLRAAAKDAVHAAAVVAPLAELFLDLRDGAAGTAFFIDGGAGLLGHGNNKNVDRKEGNKGKTEFLSSGGHNKRLLYKDFGMFLSL